MTQYSDIRNPQSETRIREILTPRQAAEYLSVHVRTIYRLAKHGQIPGRKVGGSWRFKKEIIDQWLAGKTLSDVNLPAHRAGLPGKV